MTVQELVAKVASRLAEQNGGRDLTRLVEPILLCALDELERAGFIDLSG